MLIYQNVKATIKQYWNITYIESGKYSEEYYSNRLYEILKSSVKRHLVSDVPLGAFLSGGIDSSVLVSMMSTLMDKPVKTFTIAFEEEGYDESKYARMVAKRFGTDHYELIVKPDTVNILPKLIWHLDEPLGDSCVLPMYYLSKFAREYVKVVLSGDGGDELFAGYDRYRREKFTTLYGTVPRFIRKSLIWGLISRFPDGNGRIRLLKSRTEFFNKNVNLPLEKRYLQCTEIMSADIKYQLLTEEVKHDLGTSNTTDSISLYFSDSAASNSLNKMLYVDMKTYLPDDLLTKVDKMTMAHSLEARVPFLDHNVVEFAAIIPVHLKLKGFMKTKYLLRKYLKQYFPSEIYNRRKKGFNLPIGEWLRKELRDFTRQTLLDSKAVKRGYFEHKKIEWLLKQHQDEKANYGDAIWALIVFELWCQQFIDRAISLSNQ
jgi:asparagine synthase (glutamine-hydrolysing)